MNQIPQQEIEGAKSSPAAQQQVGRPPDVIFLDAARRSEFPDLSHFSTFVLSRMTRKTIQNDRPSLSLITTDK
jgi:hypothetical protein